MIVLRPTPFPPNMYDSFDQVVFNCCSYTFLTLLFNKQMYLILYCNVLLKYLSE